MKNFLLFEKCLAVLLLLTASCAFSSKQDSRQFSENAPFRIEITDDSPSQIYVRQDQPFIRFMIYAKRDVLVEKEKVEIIHILNDGSFVVQKKVYGVNQVIHAGLFAVFFVGGEIPSPGELKVNVNLFISDANGNKWMAPTITAYLEVIDPEEEMFNSN